MDSSLDLLLPRMVSIDGLEESQKLVMWKGKDYPKESLCYKWGDLVEFLPAPAAKYLYRFLPVNYFDETWIALSLRNSGLELFLREIDGATIDWKGRSLESILALMLSKSSKWVFAYQLHSDQVDRVYEMSVDSCLKHFKETLKLRDSGEGFIAWAQNSAPRHSI